MGRVSTFADADVIKMASDRFVPVCTDDWYTRRRQDAEGEFFRTMATAAGRKGDGGATRQGIYVFAADGTVLGYKNAGQDAGVMKQVFRDALAKFDRLAERQRTPGAIEVPDRGRPDPKYKREVPKGGLVVRVHTRILERKGDEIVCGACDQMGGDKAARDFLWLTKEEVAELAPVKAVVGHSYPVPDKIAARIARFHLLDNTRGEPDFWKKGEVKANALTLTVTAATADAVELRLDGAARMEAGTDPAKARGYDVKLRGELRYRPGKGTFDKFDAAALGLHWGDQPFARPARPGKTPLGVAFTLADVTKPGNTVPPLGVRYDPPYWGRE
jgi:hypothetical protein